MSLVLLSSSASAELFTRIPDLAQLVPSPERGTYALVCATNVGMVQAGGYNIVTRQGGPIKLEGFPSLTYILMLQPGRDWDPIATTLLVDICLERETTYTIDSGRRTPLPRDTDPDNTMGTSKRTFIPQVTRP